MHNRKQMGDCIVLAMVDWIVCILIGHWQTWSMITKRVLGEQDVATFSYSDSFYLLEKGSLYIPHNIYKSATIVFKEKGLRMRFFWRILY